MERRVLRSSRSSMLNAPLRFYSLPDRTPRMPDRASYSQDDVNKLCVVCSALSSVDHSLEYLVFIIDVAAGKDGSVATIIPKVRLDFLNFQMPAFCILGSTLYVIESHNDVRNIKGKSVLTYQLSDNETNNFKVERSMLKEAPPMNGHKVQPRATVTPDGNKILVFSSVIDLCLPNEFDFELYEPEKKLWCKLPPLPVSPLDHRDLGYFLINSFTFINNKNLLFIRTEVGVFVLDFQIKTKLIWKTSAFCGDHCILPARFGNSQVVIGKEICLTPWSAHDLRGIRENLFNTLDHTYPEMFSFSDGYSHKSKNVILLGKRSQDFNVCFIDAGRNDETELPELMIQIYNCDLIECRKGLSTSRKKKIEESQIWWERKREIILLPGATKIKSFKIVATSNRSQMFNVCSFSPVGL